MTRLLFVENRYQTVASLFMYHQIQEVRPDPPVQRLLVKMNHLRRFILLHQHILGTFFSLFSVTFYFFEFIVKQRDEQKTFKTSHFLRISK